jgi:tetraacyldisaccharide 4'-kinase
MLSQSIQRRWYQPVDFVTLLLLPFSLVFCGLSVIRRILYKAEIIKSVKLPVPVIVVGNINIGGTGKTPLVIAIVQHLKAQGMSPGVVSRGYGGKSRTWPQSVTHDSDPLQVGDEAVVVANRCRCPVSVGPDRVAAARALLASHACDVIVSDDGLQHYALQRDIEIVVIDANKRFGNGLCLPAGPLREMPTRLKSVDFVVANGSSSDNEFSMDLKSYAFHHVKDDSQLKPLNAFEGQSVHAVAGIGNNERFFDGLRQLGIKPETRAYPDHYRYKRRDITFKDQQPVLMTEKDAVKCKRFSGIDAWYLRVDALLSNQFFQQLNERLRKLHG